MPIREMVKALETIFIGIPAYNEEDIFETIQTAIEKATYPDSIFIGVVLHYPKGDFPDVSMFPNVSVIHVTEPMGLGLGATRGMAASLYSGQDYFLQIDAHSVFKTGWDVLVKDEYKRLAQVVEKPIISMYVPYYYRDKETSEKLTMANDTEWEVDHLPWGQVAKDDPRAIGMEDKENYRKFAYGIEGISSPSAYSPNFGELGYEEQYFISGGFLFTSANFLKEISYDSELAYHEENVLAMLAWTRGYRIFNSRIHPLWTRGMMAPNGRDVIDSWRSTYLEKDENGVCFRDKVVAGTLRNKDILTGKVLGEFGAPTQTLLDEYEKASGFNYKKFYTDMYEVVESSGNDYPAARALYDLEKRRDEQPSN